MADEPGFLLVQAGLVRDDQVRAARESRGDGGGTLGEHLVMVGAIDDEALTAFYASKLVIPRVSAEDLARIPRHVLKRIPADMAGELRVVPIAADGELNLTLAMSDPADQHVVDEVAFFTGAYVVRAAATQLQIAWCLAHYYGVLTPLARARLMEAGDEVERPAQGSAVSQALDAAEPVAPMFASGAPWDDVPHEVEDEEETGPARMPLVRRRRVQRRTSELAPRSGTLDGMPDPPPEPERLPAVLVDDEELTGQREYAAVARNGAAALDDGDTAAEDERTAERRITEPLEHDAYDDGNGVPARMASGSGEILVHVPAHGVRGRTSPQTEPGLGRFGAVDSRAQASHDTGASRGHPWVENEGENDTVRRQSKADRRGRKSRSEATSGSSEASPDVTEPPGSPESPESPESNDVGRHLSSAPPADNPDGSRGDSSDASDDSAEPTTDPGEPTTNPMLRLPLSAGTGTGGPSGARGEWNVDEGWDLDDGWSPPGGTIPPEYLGARPDSELDQDEPTPVAPLPARLGAKHSAAAASAAAAAALAGAQSTPAAPALVAVVDEAALDPAELAAELDRSSNRLLETLRALERAPGRDEIVDILLDHLGASMRRRAFFAVKGRALVAFRQYGAARPGVGTATLSLDEQSTFAQIALNRIVYRGPLSAAADEFVENVLGSASKGDAVLVPVEVRGRPVGLLYGDGLTSVVFEEHQTVLGRAAGQAFERILSQRAARESGGPS